MKRSLDTTDKESEELIKRKKTPLATVLLCNITISVEKGDCNNASDSETSTDSSDSEPLCGFCDEHVDSFDDLLTCDVCNGYNSICYPCNDEKFIIIRCHKCVSMLCKDCYNDEHPGTMCDVTKRECDYCKGEFFIEKFYECGECSEEISCEDCLPKAVNSSTEPPLLSCLGCKRIYHDECFSGRLEVPKISDAGNCDKCGHLGCQVCGSSDESHKC